MKILTICRAGCVRSVALMRVLKERFNHWDTICAGIETNEADSLRTFFNWADVILVTDLDYMPLENANNQRVPLDVSYKTKYFPIGPDIWGNPMNPELIDKIINIMKTFEI